MYMANMVANLTIYRTFSFLSGDGIVPLLPYHVAFFVSATHPGAHPNEQLYPTV